MNIDIQNVIIPVGNEKLSGLLYVPKLLTRKIPSVVILHGRGSSKKRYDDRAMVIADKGILTLTFDFRGCGESDGRFIDQTIKMGFEDTLAGYDYLVSQPSCDTKRIGVLGGSFGGYQAALLAQHRPVKSLILVAPAIYQDEWWNIVPETMDPERKALYRQQADISETKAMKAIKKYSGKLLVVEHEKDELIPKSITQSYFDTATKTAKRDKQVIPSAPHALHDQVFLQQSCDIVSEWFAYTL